MQRIRTLWDGYGEIVRDEVDGRTVIKKTVRPPPNAHPRKIRSYEVEGTFYETYAPRCDDACRVAKLVERRPGLLVLEDLDAAGFPKRDGDLEPCLAWLAAFHARFLGVRPDGLWKIGTYWHLDTRREELAAMRDDALRRRAPEIDRALREAKHQTIVHGDAKPENFCWSRDGARVAAVDFQYVGGGPGIKDVAYLLHGERDEGARLDAYFAWLANAEVEREWRALYPAARDDFARFLDGWRR